MEPCKSFGAPVQGVLDFFFHKLLLLFWLVVSNPFNVLEVGKILNQNFTIYHPEDLPDFGLAPSGENHKLDRTSTGPGWMHIPWEISGEVSSLSRARSTGGGGSCQRGAKLLEKLAALTPPKSATRSERFLIPITLREDP